METNITEEKPLTKEDLAILIGNRLKTKSISNKDFINLSHQLMVLLFPRELQQAKRKPAGRPKGAKNKKKKPVVDINALVKQIEAERKEQANG